MSTRVSGKPAGKVAGKSAGKSGGRKAATPQRRRLYIFAGLLGVLTFTSGLLVAMSPAPLKPDVTAAAFAADRTAPAFTEIAGVFDTHVPVQTGRWEYIYVHHAGPGAPAVDPNNSSDHFVIEAPGANDGQIRMTLRWSNQASANPPAGAQSIHPRCVSILLTGNLDQTMPSQLQVQRCTELVRTLQHKLGVPDKNVLLIDARGSATGTGRYFPTAAFRENLLGDAR